MRKSFLQNEKKEAQRKKILVVTIGIILIAIMFFSSFGMFFNGLSSNNSAGSIKEYGQFFAPIVTDQGQTYRSKLNGVQRDFLMLPTQVSYVEVTPQAQQVFPMLSSLQTVVLTVNTNSDFGIYAYRAASNLFLDLYSDQKQIIPAIMHANETITTIPIISCEDQSFFEPQNLSGKIPIIQVQEANQTSIRVDQNCIFIEGVDGQSIVSAVERLRYGVWGLDFTKDAVDAQ